MWRNWFCGHDWSGWGATVRLQTTAPYPTWVQFKKCKACGKEKKRVV